MKRSLLSHIGEAFMRWADSTCDPESVDIGAANLRQCLIDLLTKAKKERDEEAITSVDHAFFDGYIEALKDVAKKFDMPDTALWS